MSTILLLPQPYNNCTPGKSEHLEIILMVGPNCKACTSEQVSSYTHRLHTTPMHITMITNLIIKQFTNTVQLHRPRHYQQHIDG